ncbi:MAG: DUF5009 domain-containing protein [Candidatus Bathyarchaeia archaeon]|jgi:predicted acyltransferase
MTSENLAKGTARPSEYRIRIGAFDIFRGVTVALMIIVGNIGYNPYLTLLQHAEWNGLTIADLVMPFFIFTMGLIIPYSLKKRQQLEPMRKTLKHIASRAFILFTIGFFLNNGWPVDLTNFRVMSVLQRLALCYLFVSLAYLFLKSKWRIAICVGILVLYSFSGTLPMTVDRLLLGNHIYITGPNGYDPEGLLSTVSAFSTCLIGAFIGEYIYNRKPLKNLVVYGGALIAIGVLWSAWLPLNKSLYSSSYSVLSSGISILVLLSCFLVQNLKAAKVFTVLGMNAILIYTLNGLMNVNLLDSGAKTTILNYLSSPFVDPFYGTVIYTFLYLLSLWLIAFVLYKCKIFIRV